MCRPAAVARPGSLLRVGWSGVSSGDSTVPAGTTQSSYDKHKRWAI